MATQRMHYHCSSSIGNFQEKLDRRLKLPRWSWRSIFRPALFVGLYHEGDYLRFLSHRGQRRILWCGADILALQKRGTLRWMIAHARAQHFCENEREREHLLRMGIVAEVIPMIFDDPEQFMEHYEPSERPHVYLTAHQGRGGEYGVHLVEFMAPKVPEVTFHIYGISGSSVSPNVRYHGIVPSPQFDQEIRSYQACLRTNHFDGFSETLAKSVLLGQYPITMCNQYPDIAYASSAQQCVRLLSLLSTKQSPNTEAAQRWCERLEASYQRLLV